MTGASTGVRCMIMRGGTSKGAFFLGGDLPADPAERDRLLLAIMGSPDARQIDGIGGATPLTSKVAVVTASTRGDADVDYLFLQVGVDEARVSDRQNCGNLLAATAQFALERNLISAAAVQTDPGFASVRVYMANTDSIATTTFPIEADQPVYSGSTAIDGVPGTAATVRVDFEDVAGGSCGSLLPTGNQLDHIDDVPVTLIDNGMPVVVMQAGHLGITGSESPLELDNDRALRRRLESIRLQAGPLMRLGDVTDTTVPKLTMVSPPAADGHLSTRTFIPHRCHDAIGVLGAVSVASAALLPDSSIGDIITAEARATGTVICEHPTGSFTAAVDIDTTTNPPTPRRAGIVRTARKLMDGNVFPAPHEIG